jgi:hypothetical protein
LTDQTLANLLLADHLILYELSAPVHGHTAVHDGQTSHYQGVFAVLQDPLVVIALEDHQVIAAVGPNLQVIPVNWRSGCRHRRILRMGQGKTPQDQAQQKKLLHFLMFYYLTIKKSKGLTDKIFFL